MNPDDQYLLTHFKQLDTIMGQKFKDVHGDFPRRFVVQNGFFCTPSPKPKSIRQGKPSHCFQNATRLVVKHDDLTYVEGYAISAETDMPVHHGWCIDSERRVIDTTWETPGLVYFGIPFDTTFLFISTIKQGTAILWTDSFFECMTKRKKFVSDRWKVAVKKESKINLKKYESG